MGQSRLNITDTQATLGTRHRTKTNKAKNTTQKTKQISTDPIKTLMVNPGDRSTKFDLPVSQQYQLVLQRECLKDSSHLIFHF